MKQMGAVVIALLPLVFPGPGGSADARIERTLRREPAYQGSPCYCLLVFGEQPDRRICLALDSEFIYADRNGDGDLAAPGKRKEMISSYGDVRYYEFGALTTMEGQKVHIAVRHSAKADESDAVTISLGGKAWRMVSTDFSGPLKFGATAQEAPIVRCHGPLQMALREKFVFQRGGPAHQLNAVIGTSGIGKGTFASQVLTQIPADVHPLAEIEFPNKESAGAPIKLTVPLTERC